jgi:uncharacterized protein
MNPVVHFELPYKDAGRAILFYKNVFGWEMEELDETMGNYILATTAIKDAKPGFPAGAINGGLFPVKSDWPAQYPSIVIGVENMALMVEQIKKNGGEVLGEPMDIPGVGLYVAFLDTEGNRNSIIHPKMA